MAILYVGKGNKERKEKGWEEIHDKKEGIRIDLAKRYD